MSRLDHHFTAILLAAQRPGATDALAAEAGVANKSLVPILGRPLIRHVVDALLATPGLTEIRIVIETQAVAAVREALPKTRTPITFVQAADNLADSVYAAARGVRERMLITTSDNVLLTPGATQAVLTALENADVSVALAAEASVKAAHPDGQRRFYRFADGAFSNCNLYGLAGPKAVAAAESFRRGGQFAKKPLRMIMALGPITLFRLLTQRLTLAETLARVSRGFRLDVAPVILADGSHAIDVDNARTFGCAETLLRERSLQAA